MHRIFLTAALCAISTPAIAQDAAEPPIAPGEYRDRSSFEMFHGLRINEDGTFEWAVSAGAMDRRSTGTWEVQGDHVVLTTTPTPVPPEFVRGEDDTSEDAPFLMVRWPSGEGIAGIDFTLTCEGGKRIMHYTQYDGWDKVPGECDEPESISLEEGIQDIGPTYFPLYEGEITGGLTFTLQPNDFGVMDLTGTRIRATDDGIELWLMGSSVTMVRIESD